jgi:large subunit ribosomal protein L24
MGAALDKKLREKYGKRSIEVVKGDEVKIMRGKFKGKQGKVGVADVKNTRIQVDGVQRTKAGGEKLETWFHPSNVKIIVLNDKDSRRFKRSKVKATETPKVEKADSKEVKEASLDTKDQTGQNKK